ncbi:D-arabinono-1,4-lactone oxidase [Nocardioides sp. GY 10127]|uniref:D-arabinono-1,4-lactone oxidase n=1 Tax=Nocardioides sp. GY 10127 TaxID=2569762 RepID=UPI0010A7792A|nr:D-arabinono-1,4-lactone oxidase [Nocardioides sp. GY 10127]TIC81612.1 FAD-binding protein [Nocardioides sp. GY 10127]
MSTHATPTTHPTHTWQNWARVEGASPTSVARPRSPEEVVDLVVAARERGATLKPVGAGHSFTAIAATDGIQVDVGALSGVLEVDAERGRVRLGAGTHLHELPALLAPHGLALENMGDIDRQTIAGATSTGTHGTGARFGGLATQLVGVTLVTGAGELLTVSEEENAELLPAVRLGLGALGVLVDVTVQCVPAFLLRAHESSAGLDEVLDDAGWFTAPDHAECYWWPGTDRVQTKINTRLPLDTPYTPPGALGRWVDQRVVQNGALVVMSEVARLAPATTLPLNRLATKVLGEKTYTDRSYAVFTSPRDVRFRECEYAVPREALPEVVRALRDLVEREGWRISFPVELRVAAADDVWLSTAYQRDSAYVAVHRYWKEDHLPYFRAVDALMREFEGRPHWGKIHFQDAESLARVHPRLGDFQALRDRLDPDRVLANDYLRRVLGD